MKSYIWGLPTRLFHWLLAIGFTITYILGDFENLSNFHFGFGAFVGSLIFFRLLYGFLGPKYSHFSDFPIGLRSQIGFLKSIFSRTKLYTGHNPSASVIMLMILVVGLLCSISGYGLYSAENNSILFGIGEESLKEIHEILANSFLILVIVHLIGILSDLVLHKSKSSLLSMITGYKNIEAEDVKLTGFQKIFSFVWILVPIIMFYFGNGLQINEKENEKSNIERINDDD